MYSPILFYGFGGMALIAAFLVITSRNPVYAVLSLVVVFLCSTALVLLLEVDFLALLFLIVYVGAIAILFLFVVMMLDIKLSKYDRLNDIPIGGLIGGLFLGELLFTFYTSFHSVFVNSETWISVLDSLIFLEGFGQVLYLLYIPPFLLAGFILLVAMVGAIVLTAERRPEKQVVFRQLSRQQRLFLISSQ